MNMNMNMNMKTTTASNKAAAIRRAAKAIDDARISLRAAAHANDGLPQGAKRAGDPDLKLMRLVTLEHRNGDRVSQPKDSDRQFEQSFVAFNPTPSHTLETAQAQGESHGAGKVPFIIIASANGSTQDGSREGSQYSRGGSAQCFGGCEAPRKSSDHEKTQAA